MNERPPRRWRRRAVILLVVLAALVGGGLVGVRLYLSSSRAAGIVREQLAKLLNTSVEVGSASIGLVGQSTLSGLKVGDYLEAERAEADLSAAGAVGGSRPTALTLDGVKLRLRFDKDGNLLTKLPSGTGNALPTIRVKGATVILDQEGRTPFALNGGDLELRPDGSMEGKIEDDRTGTFTVAGTFQSSPAQLKLSLSQEHARVTPALLKEIPFIPPALWTTLTADGEDVDLAIHLDVADAVKYRVAFKRAAVTLLQSDRPNFRVTGAGGTIDGDAAGFTLKGAVADPRWGGWNVDCKQANASGAIDVHLKTTAPVKVDQKMLEALPFVPKTVWANVQAEGKTPAEVSVRLWTNKPEVNYRIAVEPTDTKLHVSAIDLKAEGVGGKVLVEDAVVKLENVSGATAKGKVHTSGTLDFRGAITSLAFAIKADQLWLKQLPTKWEVPDKLSGKLSGQADIVVKVDDKVMTSGSGQGRVTDAAFGLVPIFGAIELELYAEKGRLKFRTGKPAMLDGVMGLLLIGAAPPVERPPPSSPAGIASRAGDGVLWLTRGLADGAKRTLDGLSNLEKMSRPGVETTYLDAKFALKDADLITLAKQFNLTLPGGLAGKASIDLTASIPINNARDAKAYRLTGTLTSPHLEVGGYSLGSLRATLRYADGLARLTELSGNLFGGSVSGAATAQLVPLGVASFDLATDRLNLLDLLPRELRRRFDGVVSGRVRAAGNLENASDVRSWRGTATVRSPRLDVQGVPLRDAAADLTLAAGTLLVNDLRAETLGAMLSARGGVNLIGGYRYDLSARLRGLDVSRLTVLLPAAWTRLGVTGALDVTGQFQGSLAAGAEGSGRLRASSLRLGDLTAGPVQARWKLAGARLTFDEVQGVALGGKLTGKGDVSRAGGTFNLQLVGVDAARLARAAARVTVPVRGTLDAKAKVTLGFEPFRTDIDVDLGGSRVSVAGVPVQNLTGRVVGRDGRLDYQAQGDVLGGRARIEGRYPPPPMGSVGQPHGRLRIDRLFVGRALAAFSPEQGRGPWRGVIALDLPYRHDGPGGSLTGNGRFEIRDLRYNDSELADSIRGDLRLTPQGLSLRDVSATFAGGQLRLRAAYRLDDPSRSWFDLTLMGADTGRLATALGQKADGYRGGTEIHLRGTLGPEWRGTGEVRLTRGRAAGVDVGEWGLPLDFTYVPARGHGEIHFRESSARVGSGRARARGQILFGESARVNVTIELFDAGIGALSGLIGDVTGYIKGQVTGRVDISGSEVRTPEDLTATVQAKLREAQPLTLPILDQIAPFLLLPGGRYTMFNTGVVRGRLSRGVFRFEEFTLASNVAQMRIDGSVTTAGRLDLVVIARTASLGNINPVVLRLLVGRVPAVGPVPVGVVLEVTQFFADRVVYLKVTGTTRRPVVQVEPLRLLSQEAVRWLLRAAVR